MGLSAEQRQREFISRNSKVNKNADEQVLGFIAGFLYREQDTAAADVLWRQFQVGYCYFFAHMLETAFHRGTVCWVAPYGHFVWVDNGIPYDIGGVNTSDCLYYIPEAYLGESIKDFLHIPGAVYNTSEQEIAEIIERYEKELPCRTKNCKSCP